MTQQIANVQGFVGSLLNSTTELSRRLPQPTPEFVSIDAYRFVRRQGQPYKLTPWGTLSRRLVSKNLRPGKLGGGWKEQPADAILESAFAGPGAPLGAFDRATDKELWEAGVRFANEQALQPNEALTLARAIVVLLTIRAGGGVLTATELP